MIEIKWQDKAPRASSLRTLRDMVEAHREQLLEEWEQKVLVSGPGPGR